MLTPKPSFPHWGVRSWEAGAQAAFRGLERQGHAQQPSRLSLLKRGEV